MPLKKILMPVLDAGAGHRMPAQAVKDALETLAPGKYQIDVIDYVAASGAMVDDARMKSFWNFCLGHPRFARTSYWLMDHFRWIARLGLPVVFPDFVRKGQEYVRDYAPDLIFSTHYYSLSVAAMGRDTFKLPIKAIGFCTDPFDAYLFWCEKRADMLMVASEKAKRRAIDNGYPPEKIMIVPFPINSKFLKPSPDRAAVLSGLGLDLSLPTILASQGGQGIGLVNEYLMEIYRRGLPVNIIAVCGRSEEVQKRLQGLIDSVPSKTRLKVLGFVDNMQDLLKASDLFIAKGGASTTFEALFCRVPTIFTSYVVQAERPNIDFFVELGGGWYAPDTASFWKAMDEALAGDKLAQARSKLAAQNFQSGSSIIAQYLIDQLES